MTIAATYPAAVIGMALIKLMKGTILEENMARTVGSIGESVAALEEALRIEPGHDAAAVLAQKDRGIRGQWLQLVVTVDVDGLR